MSGPASRERPIWSLLEHDAAPGQRDDPGHWVSVYADLLALLSRGARVSIAERSSGEQLQVDPAEVSERLLFWQSKQRLTLRESV